MSRENVALVRRVYAALNSAYAKGDVDDLRPFVGENYTPDLVLKPSGLLPEGEQEMRGHEGLLRFVAIQMEAFTRMWIEPADFTEAGDKVVVPVRFGGRARHTGIEVEFSVVHVGTLRDGKIARIDMYPSKAEALEAAGLTE
jgi:ketosteroid isomerase-like protein